MGDMGVIAAEGSPCTRAKEVPTAQGTSTTLTRSFRTLRLRHNGSKGVMRFAASWSRTTFSCRDRVCMAYQEGCAA